jgi:hypothetical protein
MGGSKDPNGERMGAWQSGAQNLNVVTYLVWNWFHIYKTASSNGYLESKILFKFELSFNTIRNNSNPGPSIQVQLNTGPSGVYFGLSGSSFSTKNNFLANFFRLVFMKYYFTRKKDRCNT